MKIHVLASGSTGNAILLKFQQNSILVDAGISARRIATGMKDIGEDVAGLSGILLTHEHHDHVKGLVTMAKKYKVPIYARPETWRALSCRDLIPMECQKNLGDSLDLGSVKIEPFSISHDAANPVGFCFYEGSMKVAVATDLGFVTPEVKYALRNSQALVFESNHDVDMLRNGGYPWSLKRRIMSNRGHLSNVDAAWTLARLERPAVSRVLLAHLSQQNNRPELAMETVRSILDDQQCDDIQLHLTFPDTCVSITVPDAI